MNKREKLLTELNTLSLNSKADNKEINELSEIDIRKFITTFTTVKNKNKFKYVLNYDFSIRLLDDGCFALIDMTYPLYVTIVFRGNRTTFCYIHRHDQFKYEVEYHINYKVYHTFKATFDALIPHHYDVVVNSVGYTVIKHLENYPIIFEIIQDGYIKCLFYKTYEFLYEDSTELELYVWEQKQPKYEYPSEKYQHIEFADKNLFIEHIPEHFREIVIESLNL